MGKTRPDSIEARLHAAGGDDYVNQVRDWMLSGMSYSKVRTLSEEQLGVTTSLPGLSGFHSRVVEPYILERRRSSARLANVIVTDEARQEGQTQEDAAFLLLQEYAFTLLSNEGSDPEERSKAVKALLTFRGQKIEIEKLKEKLRTKLEAGLSALEAEIGSNPKAKAAFETLRESLAA